MGRMSATGRSLTVPRIWRASIVRLAKGYGRARTAVRILRTVMIFWASILEWRRVFGWKAVWVGMDRMVMKAGKCDDGENGTETDSGLYISLMSAIYVSS